MGVQRPDFGGCRCFATTAFFEAAKIRGKIWFVQPRGGHERLQNEHCGFAVVDVGGATNWERPPHARKETRNEPPRELDGR